MNFKESINNLFLLYFQIGETTIRDETKLYELIHKLVVDINEITDQQTPLIQQSLDEFQTNLTALQNEILKNMDKQDDEWRASLTALGQKAKTKNVNIDSCLGQNEVDLLKQFRINYGSMKTCSAAVILANEESSNKYYALVCFP